MASERNEAARALREAEAAAGRSVTAFRYARASGHLLVWGAVWIAVNVAGLLRLPHGTYIFPALMLAGVAGSVAVGLRGRGESIRGDAVQSLLVAGAILLFTLGFQVVSPTGSLIQTEAMICLAIGAAYILRGGQLGWRLSAIGVALMVGTILGWTYAREQFFAWMVVVGGGGLILGGLWLRKA